MSNERLLTATVRYVKMIVELIGGTREASIALRTDHTAALEAIETEHARVLQHAETTAHTCVEQAKTESVAIIELAQTRASDTIARLNTEYDTRRLDILDESDSIRSQAAKKADEAKWLAESMYEAALTEPERDLRHADAECNDAKQRSAALLERIDKVMPTLPQLDQPFPPGPELPDPGLIDSTLIEAQDILDTETTSVSTNAHRWIARFVAFAIPGGGGIFLVLANTTEPAIGLGVGMGVGVLCVSGVWMLQHQAQRRRLLTSRRMAERAATMAQRRRDVLARRLKKAETKARDQREIESTTAREQLADLIERAGPRTKRRLEKLGALRDEREERLNVECDTVRSDAERDLSETIANAQSTRTASIETATTRADTDSTTQTEAFHNAESALQTSWTDGLQSLDALHTTIQDLDMGCGAAWSDDWATPRLPSTFAGDIRIATMQADVATLGGGMPDAEVFTWTAPDRIAVPLSLDLRDLAALRIEHDAESRTLAMSTLRSIVLRALTTIPPGRLRLVLCDPVGLGQEFAGFMHLADQDEADILTRIWTEPQHIEQRLTDLTEHMENVIQTYLRNEYESIEEYNEQAGEIAEPYRLLVMADFPEGLTERGVRRLESIIASGRRCGVFTMILRDPARPMPDGLSETALNEGAVRLRCTTDGWSIVHPELPPVDISIEPPPGDNQLTGIVECIGEAAAGSRRVEVPFSFVAPTAKEQWTASTAKELRIPVGQSGATRRLEFRLGRGTTQHALIAGKTGSGKSTLLHVLITNLALWCSPDEVEFYLVDFKKGVEFQAYAARKLPHARVVAIESDREFGLSVLRRLDAELRRRGELFRDLGVQDITAFRATSDDPMPRVLLIIDEFQEFFIDDDPVAQEASLLLDRLVRQGRAFGMHAILGSQTLDGAYSLARSTLGQMGIRIALQCSEGDSYLILSDDNPAARLLGRPGEAIYNDAGGKVEGNTPFQVVWLEDRERDAMLDTITALNNNTPREQFVFRGHIPASLPDDRLVRAALAGTPEPLPKGGLLPIRLGEPVAIAESTDLILRPQAGGNALLVGQHPEAATAVLTGALVQAALRIPPAATPDDPGLQIWLIDGQSPDAMLAGRVSSFAAELPHVVHRVTSRNLDEGMAALAQVLADRADGRREGRATILVLGIDLHRLRDIRVREDDFSFSATEEPEGVRPDKILADLLREGPAVGMHAMLWFDGTANLSRTLDRSAQREFEQKVLFQMSANDSGQMIDSTAASDLGLHRGLLYVEDTGMLEKFRPWALPDHRWLQDVAATLRERHGG